MAFINNKGHGHDDVAAAVSFQTEVISLTDDLDVYTTEVGNRGMPRVTVYLRQTAGVVPAQAVIEFSTADQVNKVKLFFPATAAIPTPLNVPVLTTVQLPSKFIRVKLTRPAGQASTVEVVIMVAQ